MALKQPSLDQIDDSNVFMERMLGIVHQDCSPWSSQEIEDAYHKSFAKQHLIGSSLPIPCKDRHLFPTPLTGVKSTLMDCNICLSLLTDSDIIMRVPVTVAELKNLSPDRKLAMLGPKLVDCDCSMAILSRSGCQNPFHK
jgi:hypothetical protein